jgi:hypothetical protein
VISVTGASKYLEHSDADPMAATLVVPDKQVGAVMVVGTVTTRLNRLVRAIEKVERENTRRIRSDAMRRRHDERRARATHARREAQEQHETRRSASRGRSSSVFSPRASAGKAGGAGGGGILTSIGGGVAGGALARFGGKALPFLGKAAGKAAAPLAAILGGYGVYSSVKNTGKADILDAITGGAGAGAIGGAAFAGVGAIPGAVIGGLLGGAGAIIYNSRESIGAAYRSAKETVTSAASDAADYAKDKWSSVTTKLGNTVDYAKEKLNDAWESVKATAGQYRDQVTEWLGNQGKTLHEWFDSVTAGLRSAVSLQSLRAMASEWLESLKSWFRNKLMGGSGGGGDPATRGNDTTSPTPGSYGGGPPNPSSMYAPGSGGYAGGSIATGGKANWGAEGGVARGFQPTTTVKGGEFGYAPQGSQGKFSADGIAGGSSDIGNIGRNGFGLGGPQAGGASPMSRPDATVPRLGGSSSGMPQFWQYGARVAAPEGAMGSPGSGIVSATNTGERAYKNQGSLVLRDPKTGAVLGSYPYVTGGGGKGSLPEGEYNIGDMMRGGSLGDRWRLTQKGQPDDTARDPGIPGVTGGSQRSAFRIHQAHGSGTLGCIGILGGNEVYQDFKNKLMYVIGANGGKASLRIGSPEAQRVMQNMTPVPPGASRQTIEGVKDKEQQATSTADPAGSTKAPGATDPGSATSATTSTTPTTDAKKPAWQQGDSKDYSGFGAPRGISQSDKEPEVSASSVKEKEPASEAPAEREDTPDASAPTASGIKGKRVSIDDIPTVHPNVHLAMVGASDKA